jgi:hypothetical protein
VKKGKNTGFCHILSSKSSFHKNPLPFIQTYAEAAIAKINRKSIKTKVSKLLAVTLLTPNKIVRKSWPWLVLKPVRST